MKVIKRFDKSLCNSMSCPAVLEADDGDLLIIGTDVSDEVENLSEFNAGCASYEKVIRVSKELLKSIKHLLN